MGTKKKIKISPVDRAFIICNTIFMILFVFITLYPILNTLALAFNDGTDALRGGIYLWPRKWTMQNFITVLQKDNLITGAYITVARTLLGTVISLLANAILAFIVSRKRFLFRKQLSLFWVVTMYVNGGMIPTFLVYKGLGLTNSFWVYVVPGMISAFNMLVIRTYMNGLPESLEESAQLDGAGYSTIFLKIISPLCKPVYATVALFVAVGQWNSWFDAMLYNRMDSSLTTLQYELMKLLSSVTNQGASAEAMKNRRFRQIVSEDVWHAERENSDYLAFRNKNKTIRQFEGGNGIKIGYTENSGRTLVASAKRGDEEVICVVMSAPDWFNDAYSLMEYGFEML